MTAPSPATLEDARDRIDDINEQVVKLLAERKAVVDRLCALKAEEGRTVRDPEREAELLARVREAAREQGLPPDLAESLFETILEHSVQRQHRRRAEAPETDETCEEAPVASCS